MDKNPEIDIYQQRYCDGAMDREVLPLCNALNSLPGITTISSCCGHGERRFSIIFTVGESREGLFFLARCVNSRYWRYGHLWHIELDIADAWDSKNLPIYYELHSGNVVGSTAYQQAEFLLENMNLHLNNEAFMRGYKLNMGYFDLGHGLTVELDRQGIV